MTPGATAVIVAAVTLVAVPAFGRSPAGRSGKAARAEIRNAPVQLFAVNSRETLQLRLRDEQGRPLRGVQKRFDHLMRCHHTNKQHAMNPRLIRVLYQLGKHYPGLRVEVVSGYRHPSVAKNPRSPHMKGLACDLRVAGVKNTELRDYLRRGFQKVGVGYYPNSSFVHLDIRKDRSAFWIDYSGPGDRAVYSENALADVKSGRAESYKPTRIDKAWVSEPEEAGDDAPPPGDNSEDPPAPASETNKDVSKKAGKAVSDEVSKNVNKPMAGPVPSLSGPSADSP